MDKNEKLRAVGLAISSIEKTHGKGSIMKLGDAPVTQIEAISTRSIKLDSALGIGGFPKGRIIEIFAPESAGKTTLCLQVVAEAQSRGGICAFIDTEHALDVGYAEKLGVDIKNLYLSQPEYGEQALEIVESLIRSEAMSVVVVDSVASLTPRAEIEGEMGDSHMGLQARLMSQALRKLTAVVARTGTTLIFTNQLRDKIGVMFGSPETTTGGKALKFYASVRIDMRKKDAIKDGSNIIGNRTKIKIVKNKVAPPFKECEVDIIYNEGISRVSDLIDVAVDMEIIKKGGAWFTYDEQRFQGRDAVAVMLKENPEVFARLDREVREMAGLPVPEVKKEKK
jgi:recombination protein RecA